MKISRLANFKQLRMIFVVVLVFAQLIGGAIPSFGTTTDSKGHWAEKQINVFLEKGLAKGYPDGNFKPDQNINRAEFVTLVNKAFSFTQTQNPSFSDVTSKDWFYSEIAKAEAAGYITGYNDGTFQPLKQITRQEVASILYKVLKLTPSTSIDVLLKLEDYKDIPAWSKVAIGAVLAQNYMKGYPDKTFKPDRFITRAESVVALYNSSISTVPGNTGNSSGGSGGSDGSDGSDEQVNKGITTKQDLINAVYSGSSTIKIASDIALGSTALDINRAVTINGGNHIITGDVSINVNDVTINHLTITGDLVLGEGIGEGDAILNGVQVKGSTIVKGGGTNSIHFVDSVLATVIVNKNDGAVRVVLEGNTAVLEVQLDSPAVMNTVYLTGNEAGVRNVIISDSMQRSNGEQPEVQLIGSFETINSRATNIRINLSSETDIRTLVLNAITEVLGTGTIITAEINADGSTLSQRPQNVVLDNGSTVTIGEEIVNESYSSNSNATLTGITATQASISVQLDQFVAGITSSDFSVSASLYRTVNGETYTEDFQLQDVSFNNVHNRFTFTPISLTDSIGKHLVITVEPASDKISGSAKTADVLIGTGFGGRITDTNSVGVQGAIIKFRQGSGVVEGEVYGEAVTDRYGYYSVALPVGIYTGEISGTNIIPTYLIANATTDSYLSDQNETTFRAAGLNEVKIVLTWAENPRDEDSHLVGPGVDGNQFHTWYADKQYSVNGTIYADLDWDDVTSYGPETTTIRKLVDGNYRFYVHNWSGEAPLRNSSAVVKIYIGNAVVPSNIFTVPTGDGNERYWIVFDMNVSQQGRSINVTEVGAMTDLIISRVDLLNNLLDTINWAQGLVDEAVVGDQEGNYPQEAVDALNNAISDAQLAYDNESITLEELDAALGSLSEAIDTFEAAQVEPSARTQLGYLIEDAQILVGGTVVGDQEGNYPQEAVDALNNAISNAQLICDNESATLDELEVAINLLYEAIDTFEAAQVGA